MTAKIETLISQDLGKDIAKLRYHGYHVKRKGSVIYYSKEPFNLVSSKQQDLADIYVSEQLGFVSFDNPAEAAKSLRWVKYKFGTHPILTLSQLGHEIHIVLRTPPVVELQAKPSCFDLWIRALYKWHKGGALIIVNKNLRKWGESEISQVQFEELLMADPELGGVLK